MPRKPQKNVRADVEVPASDASKTPRKLVSGVIALAFHLILLLILTLIAVLPEEDPPAELVGTVVDTKDKETPRKQEQLEQKSVRDPSAQNNLIQAKGPAEIAIPKPKMRETAPGLGAIHMRKSGFSGKLKNGKVNLSSLGDSVAEWAGGGKNGLGISGRGKTLKTINDFYCYFVIHSGDWYAALDWKEAPDARKREKNYDYLPDLDNMMWYQTDREDYLDVGPFIAYFYGFNKHQGKKVDDRKGPVQAFTPGAMSNLLRFIRVASNDRIKGGGKPKAVVLDRALLPYTYEKATGTMIWHEEGRERLRETLRSHLPRGGKYGIWGYLWNPQPNDPRHMDFDVEYLLDVRPMPPFIFMTGNDSFTLTQTEVETLRAYLARGGAIWADSGFAGHRSKFDVVFRREMKRILPGEEHEFRPLPNEARANMFLTGPDAYFDLSRLPYGMQFYDAPIEVIEIVPGVVSVVLTKNAYGNFLRFRTTFVNNRFQVGGQIDRGTWAQMMWEHRKEFFRGLGDENIEKSYALASNVLVYMLGRWPQALKMGKLEGLE
ncbi:MAG: DUF4159 domain-containing protein [Opitutales bacterium]